MLPAGSPLPDEDYLDYSIALEYQGPPVPFDVPRANPLTVDSLPIRSSSYDRDVSIPVVAPITTPNIAEFCVFRDECASFVAKASTSSVTGVDEETESEQGKEDSENEKSESNGRDEDEGKVDRYSSSPSTVSTDGRLFSMVRRGYTKKRVCRRCGKKIRLKESEACMVCDERYCIDCLIRAMGSMPEWRKCIGCIRFPIDESKRSNLGKGSRILAQVCSPLEVKQILKAEKGCAANQLIPGQLIVNERPLSQEEITEVLGCPIPPQNLKPGKYWYDKVSGLWGKINKEQNKFADTEMAY